MTREHILSARARMARELEGYEVVEGLAAFATIKREARDAFALWHRRVRVPSLYAAERHIATIHGARVSAHYVGERDAAE